MVRSVQKSKIDIVLTINNDKVNVSRELRALNKMSNNGIQSLLQDYLYEMFILRSFGMPNKRSEIEFSCEPIIKKGSTDIIMVSIKNKKGNPLALCAVED